MWYVCVCEWVVVGALAPYTAHAPLDANAHETPLFRCPTHRNSCLVLLPLALLPQGVRGDELGEALAAGGGGGGRLVVSPNVRHALAACYGGSRPASHS